MDAPYGLLLAGQDLAAAHGSYVTFLLRNDGSFQVASVPRSELPMEGIAGLRAGEGLSLHITDVAVGPNQRQPGSPDGCRLCPLVSRPAEKFMPVVHDVGGGVLRSVQRRPEENSCTSRRSIWPNSRVSPNRWVSS